MDRAGWERIVALFHDATERPERERPAFLDAACGNDTEMRVALQAMLQADSGDVPLLDRGLPEIAYRILGAPTTMLPFQEVGPYRLIRILGEGGMGVVGLAEREDTGRPVAIKFLLHAEMSSARRENFAREIKTLAKLKHPYIARLYDAGSLADGTPWFVMEYVEGARLTDYCSEQNLTIDQRLRLFRLVCDAVQYAHRQGIIHRDLKPSNILVEKDGAPRLLDFGVARQLQDPDGPAEPPSGLRFGSPEYAAPEWTRDGIVASYTDVYSLGVIFYKMLTGRLPAVAGEAPLEKPSLAACAAAGKRSLGKAAWRDLDALCLKAMHREAQQRYQSVEELIRDIDHFLKCEPLEASPGNWGNRASKFVRRNRRSVLAASLALASIAGLAIFFTVRLAKAKNAALAEAARTERVERFMLSMFGGGQPEAAPSKDLLVVTLLDRGVREADSLKSDPETQADLYETLGSMYQLLNNFPKADELLRAGLDRMKAALGVDHPKVAEALSQLGTLRGDQGKFKDAELLAQQALDLASRQLPAGSAPVLAAKVVLARVLMQGGSYDKALVLLNPIVRLQPSTEPGTYVLRDSLTVAGIASYYLGRYDAAEAMGRRALALDHQLFGKGHPQTAFDLMNLATVKATLAEYSEAEGFYREALGAVKAWYGPDHPDVASCESILARTLQMEGKNAEAETLAQQALKIQERAYGTLHPYVALTLDILGILAAKRGDLAAAKRHLIRAIQINKALYGVGSQFTAMSNFDLAEAYLKEGRNARAEEMLRGAVSALVADLPANDNRIGAAKASWGRALLRERRYVEAEKQLSAGYRILEKQTHPSADRMMETRRDLVAVYEALKEPDKAAKYRTQLAAAQDRK